MWTENIRSGFQTGTEIRDTLAERGYRRRTEDATARYNAGEINERALENELMAAGQRGLARGLDLSTARNAIREDVFSMRDREDMRSAARAQYEGDMPGTYNSLAQAGNRRGKVDIARLARRGLDEYGATLGNTNPDGTVNVPAAQRDVARAATARGDLAGADQALSTARAKFGEMAKEGVGLAMVAAQAGDLETAENKFTEVIQAAGLPLFAQIDRNNPEQLIFVQVGENGEQTALSQTADMRELTMLFEAATDPSAVIKHLADSFRAKDSAVAERAALQDERRFEITKEALDNYFTEGASIGPAAAAAVRVQQAATQAGLTPKRSLDNGMLEYVTGNGEVVFLRINEEGDDSSAMGAQPMEWTDAMGNPVDISQYAGENLAAVTQAASADAMGAVDRTAQLQQLNSMLRTVLDVGYQATGGGPAPAPAMGAAGGRDVRDYGGVDPVAAIQAQIDRPLTTEEIAQIRRPGATFDIPASGGTAAAPPTPTEADPVARVARAPVPQLQGYLDQTNDTLSRLTARVADLTQKYGQERQRGLGLNLGGVAPMNAPQSTGFTPEESAEIKNMQAVISKLQRDKEMLQLAMRAQERAARQQERSRAFSANIP